MVNGLLIIVHFEPVINPITDADEGNNKPVSISDEKNLDI